MRKKPTTNRRKKRTNRTRLSEKAPTGKDKRTSRTTSKDALIIKRIKRIISHPEQPEETAPADDDADYSDIEVEPEEDEAEEEEYVPTPEEVDEEEGLGAYYPDGNPDFATGYTFEDLKKVHRIMVTDEANEQEKQQAREVLPAVMGSDVWDEMLDEFEGARQRVARLMNNNNV